MREAIVWQLIESKAFEFALSIASGLFASFLYDLIKTRLSYRAQSRPYATAGPASRGQFILYTAMILNGLVVIGGLSALAYIWSSPASPSFHSAEELSILWVIAAFLAGIVIYKLFLVRIASGQRGSTTQL
jgi:hypothetical protein